MTTDPLRRRARATDSTLRPLSFLRGVRSVRAWLGALLALGVAASPPARTPQAPPPDPAQHEVPLPCSPGWLAHLVFEAGVGVWTVESAQLQPQLGCPEILAMDDRGRCTVLRSYSGKWTPYSTMEDGDWLAPVAVGDLDPDQAGSEAYTGGRGGRLWQIRPRASGHFESRVVGEWPGEEIHTLVLGDLDAGGAGRELLVFLASGRVVVVRAADQAGTAGGKLEALEVARLLGRVRHAVVLGAAGVERGRSPWIATVSRAGQVALLRLRGRELEQRLLAHEPMGFGRIAATEGADGRAALYVTRDDGLILRFAGPLEGQLAREVVYAGPQGPRGIAVGRFHEDPRRECVAVFGYSAKVELLTRLPGEKWQQETLFTDADKGHWLAAAELDGRNGTDELIGAGYAGRVFLLSRPPGYALAAPDAAVWRRDEAWPSARWPAPVRRCASACARGLAARSG